VSCRAVGSVLIRPTSTSRLSGRPAQPVECKVHTAAQHSRARHKAEQSSTGDGNGHKQAVCRAELCQAMTRPPAAKLTAACLPLAIQQAMHPRPNQPCQPCRSHQAGCLPRGSVLSSCTRNCSVRG
jgi:hypothetical protein